MKKKLLSVMLAALCVTALLTVLSACSKSEKDAATGGKTTITILMSGTPSPENDFETEVMPALVEAHFPDVKIEITKLPDDQFYTALRTRLASGEAPDMFNIHPSYAGANSVVTLAREGQLAPVDGLSSLSLSEGGKESFTYNGSLYAIPSGITMLGTFYNKTMFDKYSLSVPKTWNEFLSVCKTLQDNGIQPIVMGDKDMYVMQFGLYQIAASVVYPQNPDYDLDLYTGKTKFTDPGTWDKVLTMYKTLYDNGYIRNTSLGMSAQQAIQRFIDGEAAMTFDGSFNAPPIRAQGNATFERGYFPLPGGDTADDTYASISVGSSFAIYAKSKNIAKCKEILDWWYDGKSELYQAMANNGKTIVTYGYGADSIDPLFQDFVDLYNAGKSVYWCNQKWPAGLENEMEAKFGEAVGGQGTTVSGIVNAMQSKFLELSAIEGQ